SSAPIGFGDLVYLRFVEEAADAGPAPRVSVPPLQAKSQPVMATTTPGARVKIRGGLDRRGNRLLVTVACPRGLGEFGCRGVLSARFRDAGHHWRAAGQVAYRVRSGAGQRVAVPASQGLR